MTDTEIKKLKDRTEFCITTVGIQRQKFATNVGIGRSTLYMWQHDSYNLNDRALDRIDNYLKRLGF